MRIATAFVCILASTGWTAAQAPFRPPYYNNQWAYGMQQYDRAWGRWKRNGGEPPVGHWSRDPSYNWGEGSRRRAPDMGAYDDGYYDCRGCRF